MLTLRAAAHIWLASATRVPLEVPHLISEPSFRVTTSRAMLAGIFTAGPRFRLSCAFLSQSLGYDTRRAIQGRQYPYARQFASQYIPASLQSPSQRTGPSFNIFPAKLTVPPIETLFNGFPPQLSVFCSCFRRPNPVHPFPATHITTHGAFNDAPSMSSHLELIEAQIIGRWRRRRRFEALHSNGLRDPTRVLYRYPDVESASINLWVDYSSNCLFDYQLKTGAEERRVMWRAHISFCSKRPRVDLAFDSCLLHNPLATSHPAPCPLTSSQSSSFDLSQTP